MIEELGEILPAFPGQANRTRCFAHIINLIAKSVIKQFDIPKARVGGTPDNRVDELFVLAEAIEVEEWVTRATANENDGNEDDNFQDWEDERLKMSKGELQKLDDDVLPVRRVLVKVRFFEHVLSAGLLMGTCDVAVLAPQVCLRCQEFINHPSTKVVQDSQTTQAPLPHHASGCLYPMEFNLRHALLCTQVPACSGRHYR
jgi:hypothetical protein